jgi:hypothetical protein
VAGGSAEPALSLAASPTSAVLPATISFQYIFTSTSAPQGVAYDFDGDGVVDFSSSGGGPSTVSHTYAAPGLYEAKITVTDSGGIEFAAEVAVEIDDAQQLDALFAETWTGMNDALLANDVDAAGMYLTGPARLKYRRVFEDLAVDMPDIIASYSAPRRVALMQNVLEYAINRTIAGENRIFLIYMVKDGTGVWLIDSM